MSDICDIAIIGGGPVGIALALALRDSGLQVTVLEARKPAQASTDPRALALSYGSRLLLTQIGVWQDLTQISSIRSIHISQKNTFGRTLLKAAKLAVPDLGYVLPYTTLQTTLQRAVEASAITCLQGASVTGLDNNAASVTITYQQKNKEQQLHTRLAVIADGGKLLEASHPPELHDYHQSALITHVTCAQPQLHKAFERFTPQGPIALLPYQEGYELVWTAPDTDINSMLAWDDKTLLNNLQQHFGDRVGNFLTVGARSTFPLRLKRATADNLPHTVLIGNAAQTLHPVAGQGFNLGLRDAWELAEQILQSPPETLGSNSMIDRYNKSRSADRNAATRFTDSLVRLFSNKLPVVSGVRSASLSLLDCLPQVKKFVARRMMFGNNG